MIKIFRLLTRFWCTVRNHGDATTIMLRSETEIIMLWECDDCGTQHWKRENHEHT